MQERILIVDDEASVRNVVSAVLERSGYRPTTAGCVTEAIERLQETSDYSAVLCDVMMPGTDGLTLLDRIVDDSPDLPVVMVSSVQDVKVATSAFRRGAFDYVLKPFDRASLQETVGRAVEHQRLHRQSAIYRASLEEMAEARTQSLRQTMLELQRSYDITLEAMGDALDLRDTETEGHCRRVTAYTTALARACGVQDEALKTIARGAFLHDIGKIATPDRILLKPGKLDDEEMVIMREHCALGYGIVRKIPFLREAAEIVYAHQEKFDGSGYPRNLRGDAIPLGARIFAIADALDAMTSDRPYRRGRSFAEAKTEIARCSGSHFDPWVVSVFLNLPDELWETLREETLQKRHQALQL